MACCGIYLFGSFLPAILGYKFVFMSCVFCTQNPFVLFQRGRESVENHSGSFLWSDAVYIIKYFLGIQKIYDILSNAMWKLSCPELPVHMKKLTRDHYVAQVTNQSGTFDNFAHYYGIGAPIHGSRSTNVDRTLPHVHVTGEKPAPSIPHDYQWRLVRIPPDSEGPARMNFADSDIWVYSGVNAFGNDPSIHVVNRYEEAHAHVCTKCAKVFGGVKMCVWQLSNTILLVTVA